MEGQAAVSAPVDNSTPAVTPAPAAPESGSAAPASPQATPAPAAAPTPQFQPGDRSLSALEAILSMPEGADPATLFQAPAAATEPQPAEQTPPAATEPPAQSGQDPQAALAVQIPDKFKNPDGTINSDALMKSYIGMEKVLGEQGNKLGAMTQLLQEMATKGQPPAQAAPPAEPQPAEEIPKFPWEEEMTPEEKEKALEEFYADPLAAQAKRDQQTIKAMEHRMQKTLENVLRPLAPVVERQQHDAEVTHYTGQLQTFAQTHADVQEVLPAMKLVAEAIGTHAIKAMEKAGQNPLEAIYTVAKGLHRPAPPPPPTPEQLIADPNYRQKIVADPNIKNEILKGQMEAAQKGAPPPVIGAQLGGIPPAAPAEHAGSAKEAGRMAAKFFSL